MLKLRILMRVLKKFGLYTILVGLMANAHADEVRKPPFRIPFTPAKVGETYQFKVNVVEQLTYAVNIYFYLTLPHKWYVLGYFLDNESPEEEKRLGAILGGPRKTESGEWIEPGVPAQFRVQIIQNETGRQILDERVERPKTAAAYMGRYATLATKNLPAGLYTISVNYIEGASELALLYAQISFGRAHHGK